MSASEKSPTFSSISQNLQKFWRNFWESLRKFLRKSEKYFHQGHGLRGFNGTDQRRPATLTVTMLISSCWQLLSKVELRRIFDVRKRWANSGSYEFVKKNMVRYLMPHTGDSLTARVKMQHLPSTSACRPRPRVRVAFSHLQCANRLFWPLVSKYTISQHLPCSWFFSDFYPIGKYSKLSRHLTFDWECMCKASLKLLNPNTCKLYIK